MSKERRKCAGCRKEITSYPCVFCRQRSATEGPPSQSVPAAAVAMVFVVGLVLVVMAIGDEPSASSSQRSPAPSPAWYVGGDLHRRTIADWQVATYENRLATSADFVMSMGKYSSVPPDLRARASALERCISEAGRDAALVGGKQVSEIGATCGVLLGS